MNGELVQVERVVDGNTLIVLRDGGGRERVRLSHVDAPELAQPGGAEAAEALRVMVFRPHDPNARGAVASSASPALAEAGWVKLWPDGDAGLARVWTHQDGDLGQALVRQGHAWVQPESFSEAEANQRAFYKRLEAEARAARRGLWGAVDAEPRPPWKWRAPRGYDKGAGCDACARRAATLRSVSSELQFCSRECAAARLAQA